jgi:hypothetical protein
MYQAKRHETLIKFSEVKAATWEIRPSDACMAEI